MQLVTIELSLKTDGCLQDNIEGKMKLQFPNTQKKNGNGGNTHYTCLKHNFIHAWPVLWCLPKHVTHLSCVLRSSHNHLNRQQKLIDIYTVSFLPQVKTLFIICATCSFYYILIHLHFLLGFKLWKLFSAYCQQKRVHYTQDCTTAGRGCNGFRRSTFQPMNLELNA